MTGKHAILTIVSVAKAAVTRPAAVSLLGCCLYAIPWKTAQSHNLTYPLNYLLVDALSSNISGYKILLAAARLTPTRGCARHVHSNLHYDVKYSTLLHGCRDFEGPAVQAGGRVMLSAIAQCALQGLRNVVPDVLHIFHAAAEPYQVVLDIVQLTLLGPLCNTGVNTRLPKWSEVLRCEDVKLSAEGTWSQ